MLDVLKIMRYNIIKIKITKAHKRKKVHTMKTAKEIKAELKKQGFDEVAK